MDKDGDDKQADYKKDEAEAGWRYRAADGSAASAPPSADDLGPGAPTGDTDGSSVEWTASEFVAHDKGTMWYGILAAGTLLISAGLYLITRDVFSVVVVIVMAAALGVAGARKPRVISYRLDQSGLTVGTKLYPYHDYKSFSMPEDGPFASIVLVPLKRFGFPTSAFLAPDTEQKALNVLSTHLPLERGELGFVDELMRQLRF